MVKLKDSTIIQQDGSIHTEAWLVDLTRTFPNRYIEPIKKAIDYVFKLDHKIGDKRLLMQSLSMAEILVDLQTDPETVIAALLCAYVQAERLTVEEVSEAFGIVISKLITGMLRMDAIHITASNDAAEKRQNLDNLRKMLLAIIDDIRVVLIKLAEQTWLIRQTQTHSHETSQQIARDVMNIYAPLASRLGIGQLKWELEDLAFRQLKPEAYKEIAKSLDSRRIDREQYVEQVMKTLRFELEKAGLKHVDLMGRAKHIYSIYRKMKRKDVDFSHVFDV
ncbi:MAG: HD domain-containing protein, partial [Gammaproteobacteria bacterium]